MAGILAKLPRFWYAPSQIRPVKPTGIETGRITLNEEPFDLAAGREGMVRKPIDEDQRCGGMDSTKCRPSARGQ
jgi:hypothetical protein